MKNTHRRTDPRTLLPWFAAVALVVWNFPLLAAPITIRGQVLTAGGAPFPGATVELLPWDALQALVGDWSLGGKGASNLGAVVTAVTGAQGEIVLAAPRADVWVLRVGAPGQAPQLYPPFVLTHDTVVPPVTLELDRGLELTVRCVRDEEEGTTEPLAGVPVLALDRGHGGALSTLLPEKERRWFPAPRVGRTDARGRLRLPRGPLESVRLQVFTPGFESATAELSPASPATEILLSPAEPCALRVLRGSEKTPVVGVTVRVGDVVQAITDGDGRAVVYPSSAASDPPDDLFLISPDQAPYPVVEPCRGALDVWLPKPRDQTGQVVDGRTGVPISGAVVWRVGDLLTITLADRQGKFRLPRSDAPASGVAADAPGFGRGTVKSPNLSVKVPLLAHLTVAGRVRTTQGEPLVGAAVAVFPASWVVDQWVLSKQSDPASEGVKTWIDGSFSLTSAKPEEGLAVVATWPGYAPARRFFPAAPTEPVELVLGTGAGLAGTVLDEHDDPVEGATVGVFEIRRWHREVGAGGAPEFAGKTGSDGRFSVFHLPAAKFQIEIAAPGFASKLLKPVDLRETPEVVDLGTHVLRPGQTLSGVVRTTAGQPLPKARVSLQTSSNWRPSAVQSGIGVLTEDDGRFMLVDLPSSSRRRPLWVQAPGYASVVRGIELPVAEPLEIELAPAAELRGRVSNDAGEPVAGAEVAARRQIQPGLSYTQREVSTDEQGRFVFSDLGQGVWDVAVTARGYLSFESPSVTLESGDRVASLEILLGRGGIIYGTVVTADNRPALGAEIYYRQADPNYPFVLFTTVQADGAFQLSGLESGLYEVEARLGSSGRDYRIVELATGEAFVDLSLRPPVGIHGRVMDPQGEALPGALVMLKGEGFQEAHFAREDGRFEFGPLGAGTYSIRAQHAGFAPVPWTPYTLEEGETRDLEVRLLVGSVVVGTITGLSAAQIERTWVHLDPLDAGSFRRGKSGHPASDGTFRLEAISPGTWRASVEVKQGPRQERVVTLEPDQTEARMDFHFETGGEFGVRVFQDGNPVSGVTVTVGSGRGISRSVTDAQGLALLEDLREGTYPLQVNTPWGSVYQTTEVVHGGELSIEIPLGRLSGVVQSAAEGEALDRVEVIAQRSETAALVARPSRADLTNEEGEFSLQLIAGTYRVSVRREGFRVAWIDLEIAPFRDTSIQVKLFAVGDIVVSVRREDGSVPIGVAVIYLDAAGTLLLSQQRTPTGPEGVVTLSPVSGAHRIFVLAPQAGPRSVPIEQLEDGSRITLPMGGGLIVTSPILQRENRQATLYLFKASGTPWTPRDLGIPMDGWPLQQGVVESPMIAVGDWRYEVRVDDGRVWSGVFTIQPGQTTTIVVE
jgi:hypothetical protein